MLNSRYTSQTRLKGFGVHGQKVLAESSVAIIGCGGLGCIAAPYLAGAGIGKIILIDGDKIALENLHRQIIYTENDSSYKADVLATHLKKLNSEIEVVSYHENLSPENEQSMLKGVDIILECSDSAPTKYLADTYCSDNNIPMIYGAVGDYMGYLITYDYKDKYSPNLKELFPNLMDANPCNQTGIFNTTAGTIGVLQANACLKTLLGLGRKGQGMNEVLVFNAEHTTFQKFKLNSKKQ